MSNNKIRDLKEIREEIKEPKYDLIEKLATLSDDKKSLLVRIPQEITHKFNLKQGDKMRFHAKFEEGKSPKLKIELVNAKSN